jgi:hypothetical protein
MPMDRRTFTTALLVTAWTGTGAAVSVRRPADAEPVGSVARAVALQLQRGPGVTVQKLNLPRMVCFDTWHASGLYERFQRLVVWEGQDTTVRLIRRNLAQDRTIPDYRPARRYRLLVDGVERAVADLAEGAGDAVFRLPLAGLAAGWHELDIGGLADGETCPRWFAFLRRDGTQPDMMPVCTGTYDISKSRAASEHAWAWVPSRYQPTPSPLAAAPHPHFSDTAAELVLQPMGYHIEGNVHFPNVDRRGVVSTFGLHSYFYDDFISRYPRLALLDGPRGVGALSMATHIDIGTATRDADPASPPLRNIYVTDPWRLMRIADDGHITTLAGWRHKGMASHYRDTERGTRKGQPGATLELVGDWSAVPPARRGFHELWGMAWDQASLQPDPTAAPIAAENNRRPHVGHPACFVSDSQNDRVCRIEFDGRSHATPAKVTEFLSGLADPWDVVTWNGSLIVSERRAHRIAQYDVKTGALQRVLLAGAPLATINATSRRVSTTAPLADLRAQPCVAPEGLYLLDDWLYFGSFAQRQVRRVHLVSGRQEVVVAEAPLSGNSKFVKIAVSDGSFGPRGTVFIQSWDNGAPKTGFLPDGGQWKFRLSGFNVDGYGTAVAVRNGRMYFGTSRYGIWRVAKGQPMDARLFKQGHDDYVAAHHKLMHGTGGFGHFGFALPWGQSAAIDYYLLQCGHRRPGAGADPKPVEPQPPPVAALSLPDEPTSVGHSSAWYLGAFTLAPGSPFDNDGYDYAASYAVRNRAVAAPRLGVTLHSSGGYNSFVRSSFAPFTGVDIEVRTQDGQVKEQVNPRQPAEYWCYGTDGQPYPARRVAALLDAVVARHPQIDVDDKGIVYNGNSMGNGGVLHTMILPAPWRARIAYARGGVGVFMPRRINQHQPRKFPGWPPDSGSTAALWDAIDFSLQAGRDPIVRGMHYRQQFSSNDQSSEGPDGNTQLEWVNLCETHHVSAVATWVHNGHSSTEKGVTLPDIKVFEVAQQDVTLDRAHPCFTHSTGNWPPTPSDRLYRNIYPRGHYNIGLTWDHARIVDTATEVVFPLQYLHRTGFGGGIPDQPQRVTVNVTPRRPRHFVLRDGDLLRWSWDDGALTGTARVQGDVVTAEGIPLQSGAGYKRLRFFRAAT